MKLTGEMMKSVTDIFESVSEAEGKRLLRKLKLEKARILAQKLDKHQFESKHAENEITEAIHKIRESYPL